MREHLIRNIPRILIYAQAVAILIFGYAFLLNYGLIDYWPIDLSTIKILYPSAVATAVISLISAAVSLRRSKPVALLQLLIFFAVISCTGSYYLYSQNFVNAYFEIAEGEIMQGNFLGMKKGTRADASDISGIAVKADELSYEYAKGSEIRIGQLEVELDKGSGRIEKAVIDEQGISINDANFHLTGNYGYTAELEIKKTVESSVDTHLASGDINKEPSDLDTGDEPISGGVFFPPFLRDPNTIETNFLLPGSDRKYLINLVANEQIYNAKKPWKFKVPENAELKITYVGDEGFEERSIAEQGSTKLDGYSVRFASVKRWAGIEVVKDPYYKETGIFFWFLLVSYAGLVFIKRI